MEDVMVIIICAIILLVLFVGLFVGLIVCCYRCCCRQHETTDYDTKYTPLGRDKEGGFLARPREYDQNGCNSVHIQLDKDTTLDLHGYSVQSAMEKLEDFLNSTEDDNTYLTQHNRIKYVKVITGRGNHSPSGYPAIKNAVWDYLNDNGYRYDWINPGMVKIFLD